MWRAISDQRNRSIHGGGRTGSTRASSDRWFVDETYVKVAGRWIYLYRVIDQYGQVIDVLV